MSALYTADAPLKIGTRESPLALAQARETANRLRMALGLDDDAVAIVPMTTTGDQRLEKKLGEIGGKGLFTKEVEDSLLAGETDIAVHSMKDMPTELPPGLMLACYLPREDVRDAFISPRFGSIDDLPQGAVVGTASLRRQAQLLYKRPDLKPVLFRGNVQTRLRKLTEGEADATFLAMAGLKRLAREEVVTCALSPEQMLPAVSQGAIGIELRESDERAREALAAINCADTETRLRAERAFLKTLDGSCRTPIAALAELDGDRMRLRCEILRPDGSERHYTEREGLARDAAAMGVDAGEELRGKAGPDFFVEA